ncbi:MAG: DUF2500 domain-containing protein [Clostridia bacterium]|nr:DUF2500 domain-containing protein [Clostridia bacterium]
MPTFFTGFSLLFPIVFLFILGVFAAILMKGIGQWNKNNHAPRLSVPATVVAKRTNVSHRSGSSHHVSSTSTTYYVTFEVESGDRMELCLPGTEYGLLIEGDVGTLSFQGTRYLHFERA